MGYKKAFPQIVTHILQKAFFKHALEETNEAKKVMQVIEDMDAFINK